MWFRTFAVLCLAAALAACASGPRFDATSADRELTPVQAAAQPERAPAGVLWGGMVIASRNLPDTTEIEVLAYPLDGQQRPQTSRDAQGRILIVHRGYLETADYAAGRLVTALGRFTGTREGRVGEAEYVFPVLEADELYLWPKESERDGSNVHFGIGIGIVR